MSTGVRLACVARSDGKVCRPRAGCGETIRNGCETLMGVCAGRSSWFRIAMGWDPRTVGVAWKSEAVVGAGLRVWVLPSWLG